MRFLLVLLGVSACGAATGSSGLMPVPLRRIATRDQSPADSTANPVISLVTRGHALDVTVTIENFCDFKIRAGRRIAEDTVDIGLVFESAELASAFREQTINDALGCTGPGEIQHLITYSGRITDIPFQAYTVRLWIGGQIMHQERVTLAAS